MTMTEPVSADEAVARKCMVYIIDGNHRHRAGIGRALLSFYQVNEVADTPRAMEIMNFHPPAAIILDEEPGISNPLDLLRAIRRSDILVEVPVICTTATPDSNFLEEALRNGANAILPKPFKRSELVTVVSGQLNMAIEASWKNIEPVQRQALVKTVAMFNSISDLIDEGEPLPYESVKISCEPLVEAICAGTFKDLLRAVRGHDNYSYVHSLRVATFLSLFGSTIGIRDSKLMTLATGGLLHDVGKMSIPHEVLNKPGHLNDEELAIMRSHVEKTVHYLSSHSGVPRGCLIIAAQHHEKLDGTGYPCGIKGAELNDLARMASIVDIFGALTDRRVYKDPMSPEEALNIMTDMKGEIDQHLLGMFREMLLDAASDLDVVRH